jgi:hypothetical protein
MKPIEKIAPTVWSIETDFDQTKHPLKLMFIGCSHIDSLECNRGKLADCLRRAMSEGARIIFNGDNLDLMQSRNDPRRSRGALRPEYVGSYVNDIVEDATAFLSPYARNIDIMALGNHETSFMRNCDCDVNKLICDNLTSISGHKVHTGSIMGYLRISFIRGGRPVVSKIIHFRHDGGALGKRSKGILSYDILAGEYPNVDIFVTAHGHQMVHHETQAEYLNKYGKIEHIERILVSCPSFKEEWADANKSNWWCATNKGPRAVGGWLLKFRSNRVRSRVTGEDDSRVYCIPEFVK